MHLPSTTAETSEPIRWSIVFVRHLLCNCTTGKSFFMLEVENIPRRNQQWARGTCSFQGRDRTVQQFSLFFVFFTLRKNQAHAGNFAHDPCEEGRLYKRIAFCRQHFLVCSQAIDQKCLSISKWYVTDEWCSWPLVTPWEIQLVWSVCAELIESLADERIVIFWSWYVAQGWNKEWVDADVVHVYGKILKRE